MLGNGEGSNSPYFYPFNILIFNAKLLFKGASSGDDKNEKTTNRTA